MYRRQLCRILVLSPSAHSLGLCDECPEIVEITPSQGDMRHPLRKHTIVVDQWVAILSKEQHVCRYSRNTRVQCVAPCLTLDSPWWEPFSSPALHVPDASGPYSPVAYLSIWYGASSRWYLATCLPMSNFIFTLRLSLPSNTFTTAAQAAWHACLRRLELFSACKLRRN